VFFHAGPRPHDHLVLTEYLMTFSCTPFGHQITGGFVHLSFLPGPAPLDLAAQYGAKVGMPMMAPVWALGLQLSDWGCADADQVLTDLHTLQNDIGLPFDVVHLDPSWLDDSIDYLFDLLLDLPQLVQELETLGLRWLLRLEPYVLHERA
jgi:alpha-glucosidase (family GH31 glycosyl hydrolase)